MAMVVGLWNFGAAIWDMQLLYCLSVSFEGVLVQK